MSRWPQYSDAEISDVVAILKSGKVNAWTGPTVGEFEQAYADHLGRNHAIALANGSVALDLALHALDLQPGDEVIVTPRSFMASASCVPLAGGIPIFADVDRDTQNLSAATIEPAITSKTKGIIFVHLAGWPTAMEPIMQLADKHDLWVIEDCAQAHGAVSNGRLLGSHGHIASFSFCQDKIISTGGEGGLIAMDSPDLWRRAWSYKDHGKSYDTVHAPSHPPGFRWLHETFGTNWRMTSIQAALGKRQLADLAGTISRRSRNAAILLQKLQQCPALRTPQPSNNQQHAWYRLYTFVRPDMLKPEWNRDRILTEMEARGHRCFSGSCSEIYLEKAFQSSGLAPDQPLPVARELGETSLAFLIDPTLTEGELTALGDALVGVMNDATKHNEVV